ncbi:phage head closure protein [Paenibacillus glucanolyticus]|uniref:phage head closure protein n=1 Tax=Paenibacillus glucanolyticus TaxID=59843 RepID=UPI00096BDF36|nr:phage head closure protein [Paenibacillus glucanolyticus]OMF70508.1 hypothetical protein BK142_23835 [Paenibacillus glucanolyticus]
MRAYDYNPNRYDKRINSGRFNKRISFWGPVVTEDDIGNEIETFGELCKAWSMVKTTKGSEYSGAAQTNTVNVVRFVVRYSKSLRDLFTVYKTKIEVRYKNVPYDVKSIINDDEMNKTFTIIAEGRS